MNCECLSWWGYDDLVSILVMIGTVVVFLSFAFLIDYKKLVSLILKIALDA